MKQVASLTLAACTFVAGCASYSERVVEKPVPARSAERTVVYNTPTAPAQTTTVYTTRPEHVMKYANFMHDIGSMKNKPASIEDLFFKGADVSAGN